MKMPNAPEKRTMPYAKSFRGKILQEIQKEMENVRETDERLR